MRIALVSEHASPLATVGGVDAGGQNVHVAALAAGLARRGHEVVVATRRSDAGVPRRVAAPDGYAVEHVDAGPPWEIPKDELLPHMHAFAERLLAGWRRQRPDVVHAHFWMSALASLRAARPLGIPVVVTFHALGSVKRRHQGAQDTSPTGRLEIEREIVQGADAIVATCRDEVAELVAMGGARELMHVVPCGVDLDVFTPAGPRTERHPRRRRLLCVGRLVERKGIDDVIAALPRIENVELLVAGGPELGGLVVDPDARRLLRQARRQGVEHLVRLLGRVPRRALPALLRSADAVVCAPWYEPFGIVPLEAMACGVPVVTAAVGGMLDTVVDGRTGLHVPPRDPTAIADAARRLLDDESLRRRMGRAGVRRARILYGWDRVAAATEEVYAHVAAGSGVVQGVVG